MILRKSNVTSILNEEITVSHNKKPCESKIKHIEKKNTQRDPRLSMVSKTKQTDRESNFKPLVNNHIKCGTTVLTKIDDKEKSRQENETSLQSNMFLNALNKFLLIFLILI